MIYSARNIANAFIQIAKDREEFLTNMQVQKLVFFAHGWHLALTDAPLIEESIQAWNFGPVIVPLYNALKKYGNGVVTKPLMRIDPETRQKLEFEVPSETPVLELLNKIWELYGHLTGGQLSSLTHMNDSPWSKTFKVNQFGVIPNEMIRDYFKRQERR